mmetsp:Transcript_745/g.1267  ORF Transcript_745/g.1267 Transcript_745/m.1267 type:complete len:502 (-) Transcript_745:945-2450(-)
MSKRPAVEKLDLFISAKGLPKPILGRIDPFAVLYGKEPNGEFKKLATTDVLNNCNAPEWIPVTVDFIFEIAQEIVAKIFNLNPRYGPEDVSQHKYLGEVQFYLPTLCKASMMEYPIVNGKFEGGKVTVRAEKQVCVNDVLNITFAASNLVNVAKGFLSTPDPFLKISRMNEGGNWSYVWKSVAKKHTLKPTWSRQTIPLSTLCNGDKECPLLIEVFDKKRNGQHVFMGKVETSVKGLLRVGEVNVIMEPGRMGQKDYKNSGTLIASDVYLEEKPTFLDYVAGGCEISLIVGIDFTASNRNSSDPTSLHYMDPKGSLNAYEQVISSVGAVLKSYDTDNMYPVFGFGARTNLPNGPILHCFHVNDAQTEVHGVDGILEVYRNKLKSIQLMGPTFLAPIITEASSIAATAANSRDAKKQKYSVLLILTDGTINDVDATIEAIRVASSKPISIVIIGVGSADFSTMNELSLCPDAERDIVQFIEFHEYEKKPPAILAANMLSKVR